MRAIKTYSQGAPFYNALHVHLPSPPKTVMKHVPLCVPLSALRLTCDTACMTLRVVTGITARDPTVEKHLFVDSPLSPVT
jgi:hypothetical protein